MLVEVESGERIELMTRDEYGTLTLGELRRFVEEHRDAPDNTPITVNIPVGFTCDDDYPHELPEDHPEAHTADSFIVVSASHLIFRTVEEMADFAGQEEDAGQGMHAGPQIEIIVNHEEAHGAMRICEEE